MEDGHNRKVKKKPKWWASMPTLLLFLLLMLQWFLIAYLIPGHLTPSSHHSNEEEKKCGGGGTVLGTPEGYLSVASARNMQKQVVHDNEYEYEGVAVLLLLKSPKWFLRRYTFTIQNALVNIPITWAVQVIVNPAFWHDEVLRLSPGLRRLIVEHADRLLITEIPMSTLYVSKRQMRKPFQILQDTWFWHALVADRVLLFSGNGVLCAHGNTQEVWEHFGLVGGGTTTLDYLGTPWKQLEGVGGDGSTHTFRNRTTMLRVLQHINATKKIDIATDHITYLRLVSTMQQLNNDKTNNIQQFRIGTPEETDIFGGFSSNTPPNDKNKDPRVPMIVSGTRSDLSYAKREELLALCPELKSIFPSLHEPSCFGAKPNGERCAKSICALQVPTRSC